MSPLLTLNKWILDGTFQEVSKNQSRKNLGKSHAWPFKRLSPTRTIFKGDHWILPKLKQLVTHTWLILLFDTQLKQDLQIYTKFLSSSSYSCLPIKVCESEIYAKHIVQPLDTHYLCLFSEKSESWYTCSHQNLYKISEGKNSIQSHPYHLEKDFIIHHLHKKSSYNHLK